MSYVTKNISSLKRFLVKLKLKNFMKATNAFGLHLVNYFHL